MDKATLWKGLAAVASIGAGLAARNAATSMWKRRTGAEPPANPASPGTSWGQAIAWSMLVGALVGVARMIGQRGATGLWHKSTDELPEDLEAIEA